MPGEKLLFFWAHAASCLLTWSDATDAGCGVLTTGDAVYPVINGDTSDGILTSHCGGDSSGEVCDFLCPVFYASGPPKCTNGGWQKHMNESHRAASLPISSPSALAFACMLTQQACEGEGLGPLLAALTLLCFLEGAGPTGEAVAVCGG